MRDASHIGSRPLPGPGLFVLLIVVLVALAASFGIGNDRIRFVVGLTLLAAGAIAVGIAFQKLGRASAEATRGLQESLERARESEQRYRLIFEANTAVKLLVDPATADIVDANPAAAAFYGCSAEELRRHRITEINTMAPEEVMASLERARSARQSTFRFRHRVCDGSTREVEVHTGPLVVNGRELLLSIITDVTTGVEAEKALRLSEARYRELFETIPIGLYRSRPDEERFIDVNLALAEILGYDDPEELLRVPTRNLYLDPAQRQAMLAHLHRCGSVKSLEVQVRRRDGSAVWVRHDAHLVEENGASLLLGAMQDITVSKELELALERANAELRDLSMRDGLTGLFNRRFLDEALAREVRRAHRRGKPLSVLMLDVDHFKVINDTCGHKAGDEVLRALGRLLAGSVRAEDVACRYGGEEFLLVLPETSSVTAIARAETIRTSVHRLEVVGSAGPLPPFTLSVGVATLPDDGGTGESLIAAADAALYVAKRMGRDRVQAAQSLACSSA